MLPVNLLEEKLKLIKNGDSLAREDLISLYRPFVARVARKLCGRSLEWDRDDELSIGLAAFNEAIDRYDPDRRVPFPAYATLIIRSRITDFLRKQTRHYVHSGGSLDGGEDGGVSVKEADLAWERHWDLEEAREREEEIIEYKKILGEFDITFKDLVKCSPKHRDTRSNLLRVARELAGDEDLFNSMMSTGRLPLTALCRRLGVSAKIVERGRKYIIATALVWHFCEDFIYLCSFLRPLWKEDGGK